MNFFACVLLHTFLGMSQISVIAVTSSHGLSIVNVGTVIICCWGCLSQNQLAIHCIVQIYCALTTNLPSVIIFHQLLYYLVMYMFLI